MTDISESAASILPDAVERLAAVLDNYSAGDDYQRPTEEAAATLRALRAELAKAQADAELLRRALAGAYSGANLYGDDGELSDGSMFPIIDYVRDSAQEIVDKIHERSRKKLAAHRAAIRDSGESPGAGNG